MNFFIAISLFTVLTVFGDYVSKTLPLENRSIFRNLSRCITFSSLLGYYIHGVFSLLYTFGYASTIILLYEAIKKYMV